MLHQTTNGPRKFQGSRGFVAAFVLVAGCGKAEATNERSAAPATKTAAFTTQPTNADPCAWLTPAQVSAALHHPLRGQPVRVSSAESIAPSATGAGCLYELEPKAGAEPGMVSVEVKTDAMEMQSGLGVAAMGDFASGKGKSAKWDWVSGLPAGLFAGRQGHVGILIAINSAALSTNDVEPLAAKILERIPDVPFANSPADVTVSGDGKDPCAILTKAEAESALGALAVAPFRSRESTPVAYGRGTSCTYFASSHRALILTPTWSDGPMIFNAMRGISGLVSTVTGESAGVNTRGVWDDKTTGVGGALYFLKGDRMLAVQHVQSGIADSVALRLATLALGRMR